MKNKFLFACIFLVIYLSACSTGEKLPSQETLQAGSATLPVEVTISPTSTTLRVEATLSPTSTTQTTSTPAPLTATIPPTNDLLAGILGNLSYPGLFPDRKIDLNGGYAEYQDGSSAKPYVRLINRLIVVGDINGDGSEDAVAVLENGSSGTGTFIFLAPVLNVLTNPNPLEAQMIGDRTPIKNLAIESKQVIVDMVGPGPGDPACCSTWNVHKVFDLENDRLVETSSSIVSKVSSEDLSGSTWQLVNLAGDKEPVPQGGEITLHFDGDQINGLAACNNYTATVIRDEQHPESFVTSPIATTRKSCDQPLTILEQTYLARLARVSTWHFNFGYLGLIYRLDDGQMEELLFTPKGP